MTSLAAKVTLGLIATWVINIWIKYRRALASTGFMPGIRVLFGPSHVLGFTVPATPLISAGIDHMWRLKRTVFDRVQKEVYVGAGVLPASIGYYIADSDGLKEMLTGTRSRGVFQKDPRDYIILNIFGDNILSADGAEWRRQRRTVAPAFSEKNTRLVHSAAMEIMQDMTETWDPKQPTSVDSVDESLTMQVTLCVIAKAGFGQHVKWGDDGTVPEGHELTFKQALQIVAHNLIALMIVPGWAVRFKKSWVVAFQAQDELRRYFRDMISSRRAMLGPSSRMTEERHDLLNQLVHGHDDRESLTDEELIGNMFIFLFAGHETTAHTLSFALGLLAVYPDEQRRLVQQIRELQAGGVELTYDNLPRFTRALAIIYETLRLYPIVQSFPKCAGASTTLPLTSRDTTEPATLKVKAGDHFSVHIPGLHYNPEYWSDPTEFSPDRFLAEGWNQYAFIPFSWGPRACMGRRFAETMAVTVLVRLVSGYEVSVDGTKFSLVSDEPILHLRERLLSAHIRTTLVPGKLPLLFTPRDQLNSQRG